MFCIAMDHNSNSNCIDSFLYMDYFCFFATRTPLRTVTQRWAQSNAAPAKGILIPKNGLCNSSRNESNPNRNKFDPYRSNHIHAKGLLQLQILAIWERELIVYRIWKDKLYVLLDIFKILIWMYKWNHSSLSPLHFLKLKV